MPCPIADLSRTHENGVQEEREIENKRKGKKKKKKKKREMANSTLEIDFFRGESRRPPSPPAFSGIQKVVSRINPSLVKTAMASSRLKKSSRGPISKSPPLTAPLTIFFNGSVTAFHLPRDKAEAVIRMAERAAIDFQRPAQSSLDGDLPIARKKSLRRFLEKRMERFRGLAVGSPVHLS